MTNKDENGLLPCREAFEKWYTDKPGCPSIAKSDGKYVLMQAHAAWLAWQAAWECAKPKNVAGIDYKIVDALIDELLVVNPDTMTYDLDRGNIKWFVSQLFKLVFHHKQEPSGDVQLALDALDRMYNDALASQDGYGTSHDDFETIRAALTAQPDVNAELLDDTGLFCIINILEKAKVCAQNIIYDLPMGHNSGQQAIYARNYIHKAIYALQTATMQESVNAELLEALKEAVRLWEQHDPIHEYHINEWKKAIDRAEQKGGV